MQTNKNLWKARQEQGIDKDKLAQLARAGVSTHTLDPVEGAEAITEQPKKGSKKSKGDSESE